MSDREAAVTSPFACPLDAPADFSSDVSDALPSAGGLTRLPSSRPSFRQRRALLDRGATAGLCRLRTALDNWADEVAPETDPTLRQACVQSDSPYSRLIPLLVQGFKELTRRCDEIEQSLSGLRTMVPQRSA